MISQKIAMDQLGINLTCNVKAYVKFTYPWSEGCYWLVHCIIYYMYHYDSDDFLIFKLSLERERLTWSLHTGGASAVTIPMAQLSVPTTVVQQSSSQMTLTM